MSRLLSLGLVLWIVSAASAIDWLNTNANNQWADDANWSGGAQPTAADAAVISLSGANRAIVSQAGELAQDITVGSSSAGELQMTGGDLSGRNLFVGNGNTGTFDQDAGALTLSEDVSLGLSGGTGTWDMAGGTAQVRRVIIGRSNASTTGTLNQTGGTITSSDHFMTGDNGAGNLNLSGGIIHVGTLDDRAFIMGLSGTTGSSTTIIQGTAEVFANDTNVGDNAQGPNLLTVGGTAKLNGGRQGGAMRIGANNNVKGNVTVQDSGEINIGADPLNGVRSPIVVGVNPSATSVDDATLLVKDNGVVRGSLLIMADSNNSDGKVTLEGGTIDITGGFVVGSSGKVGTNAELDMSGGLLKAQVLLVNDGPSQTGVANISGGLVQLSGSVGVGADSDLGSGLMTIDAPGTVLTAFNFRVRNNGDVIHRMGDIVLEGALIITPDAGVGTAFGQGTYDLQMGSISMVGDQVSTMQGYISSGLLFSSNPLVTGFNVDFDGTRTLLGVVKVPEPSALAMLAIVGLAWWGRRRAVYGN